MKTWRSWPWTIALAAVLAGFVFLGLIGLGLRTSWGEILISLLVTGAAVAGLLRVLATGVRATPSGLIIRDLTRTTRVLWTQVRRVSCAPTDRRGVHAPVLHLSAPPNVKGSRRGTGAQKDIEITVLASYKPDVAQRRADQIEAARVAAKQRSR